MQLMKRKLWSRRGSVLFAIFVMIFTFLLSVAFFTLLPMEARATTQLKLRTTGSLVGEAGVIEAIQWINDGGLPADGLTLPALSAAEGFGNGWTYAATFHDTDQEGNALPAGWWRVNSDARFNNRTYLVATAYLRTLDSTFFEDMIRADNTTTLVAGQGIDYYDTIHTNTVPKIDWGGWGWAAGNMPPFHKPTSSSVSLTWSDTATKVPEVMNGPFSVPLSDKDWGKVFELGSPGFLGPVPEKEIPDMNQASSMNVVNGSSNPKSMLNLALNGKTYSTLPSGLNAVAGGGLIFKGSDVADVELSLVNDSYTKVAHKHDNDPSTPQFVDPVDSKNKKYYESLHQQMVITDSSGKKYTVIYDEDKQLTRIWNPGKTPSSGAPNVEVSGLTNGVVYFEKKVDNIRGASKNEKAYVADDELKFQFKDDGQMAPLFRADHEPVFIKNGSSIMPSDPTVERGKPGFSGFTLIGQEGLTIQVDGGAKLPKYGGQKAYLMSFNTMSNKKIKFQTDAQSKFYIMVSGSMLSEDEVFFQRDDPNDGLVMKQDKTNRYLVGQTGTPTYTMEHYEEDFIRGGK